MTDADAADPTSVTCPRAYFQALQRCAYWAWRCQHPKGADDLQRAQTWLDQALGDWLALGGPDRCEHLGGSRKHAGGRPETPKPRP